MPNTASKGLHLEVLGHMALLTTGPVWVRGYGGTCSYLKVAGKACPFHPLDIMGD